MWEHERRNRKLKDFINLLIKQCHCVIWSVEKIQKVKTKGLQKEIKES